MHKLRSRRVPVKMKALTTISRRRFDRIKHRLDKTKRSFSLQRVTFRFWKVLLRKLRCYENEPISLNMRHPIITITIRIPIHAMHDDEHLCIRFHVLRQKIPHRKRPPVVLNLETPSTRSELQRLGLSLRNTGDAPQDEEREQGDVTTPVMP